MSSNLTDPSLVFCPETHRYVMADRPELPLLSVTQLIHRYSRPFHKEAHAARQGASRACPPSEVLAEWDAKAEAACALGTAVHDTLEQVIRDKQRERHFCFPRLVGNPNAGHVAAGCGWLADNPHLLHTYTHPEVQVCWPEYQLAGTIDLVHGGHGCCEIVDWKTNRDIKLFGYENMYAPCNMLADSNYWHYCLQLTLYKHMLRHRFNLYACKLTIVWLHDGGEYDEMYVPNLDDQVLKMLDKRRKELDAC